jgi:hypothetical protein
MSLIFDIECDAIDAITLTHYTYLLGISDATFSYIFHYSMSVCSSPSPPALHPQHPRASGNRSRGYSYTAFVSGVACMMS